jgi:hypothetical protein
MTESRTRRRAVVVGLLAGLPVILLGGLPAAWSLVDWPSGGSAWSSAQTHDPQVAWGTSVEISGNTRTLLRPGGSSRINLGFANDDSKPVTLRHVRVTITSISAPQADSEFPCTRADFRIRPMRVRSLVIPGDAFTTLVRLDVPAWQWPNLKMRDRPVNQDGCKGASLKLGYVGYRVWSG